MHVKKKVCSSRLLVRTNTAAAALTSRACTARRWAAQRSSGGVARTETGASMEERSFIIQCYRVAAPKALLSPLPLRFVFEAVKASSGQPVIT
ncbi:uncharacterized protein MYCFIDRAFT_174382 [Pseudocercospora fijiensis CIRAD86]|uniref:Uncharacterized protein n=1 Tax=Pseudocercospora fijiensis (strain CIRAD86) TaxID=383855 RepID=M3AE66_PSEFD|nr:uncharacterized protein MYCFIDRAFT_174382 [Pseudocercospora fijiensis CIRAD86]EME82856.1 hypothetical protein MYCFIDRAFT_174382 [Pseudocercospora fijiensis CIRAD86]